MFSRVFVVTPQKKSPRRHESKERNFQEEKDQDIRPETTTSREAKS